jgi:hypothetical protein
MPREYVSKPIENYFPCLHSQMWEDNSIDASVYCEDKEDVKSFVEEFKDAIMMSGISWYLEENSVHCNEKLIEEFFIIYNKNISILKKPVLNIVFDYMGGEYMHIIQLSSNSHDDKGSLYLNFDEPIMSHDDNDDGLKIEILSDDDDFKSLINNNR